MHEMEHILTHKKILYFQGKVHGRLLSDTNSLDNLKNIKANSQLYLKIKIKFIENA